MAWRHGDGRREDVEAVAGQQCVDDREGADALCLKRSLILGKRRVSVKGFLLSMCLMPELFSLNIFMACRLGTLRQVSIHRGGIFKYF